MQYWVYMDNKVCGPFEKEKLAELANFSLSSLLCPDSPGGAQANDWKAASAFPEVLAALTPVPAPVQPRSPAAESPFAMTIRGTIIEAPVIDEPAKTRPPAAVKPATAARQAPGPAAAAPVPQSELNPGVPGPLLEKLGQLSAMLVSIGNTQSQLLERVSRVESAVTEIKALLVPAPPNKG
ncbi:MAG: hypothetical protein Q7R35_07385 [Elusimicrobiota bacterium]|nr:hypothetical protein [Elusimicrobiota bacterium]